MSSVATELFLWEQSVNSSCGGRMECDSLYELGPPPDMILKIPPPPIPPFMEDFVARLAAEGVDVRPDPSPGLTEGQKSCSLCHWADGNGVGYVELAQKGPLIDDTWFLVIISSCVAATLLGIILAIAFLKYREGKLKPLSDVALAKKEKALGLERCEAVLYPAPAITPLPVPQMDGRSRALWAGIKPLEGNHYTVDHCQPVEQKPVRLDLLPPHDSTYDYADYTSVNFVSPGYATLTPRLDHSPRPAPAASFENVGYVGGDEAGDGGSVGPDGCVVTAPRAARLLGSPRLVSGDPDQHHYEMVTPSPRRHKSLERGGGRHPPVISGPTSLGAARLPPLNGRPSPRYNLTALATGAHTLTPKVENCSRAERRHAHVSLDRAGSTSTSLAPASPTDHIYASPITSPVI